MPIDVRSLPKEVRDVIEIREGTDQTFARFVDEDYTELFWDKLSERSDPNVEHSMIVSIIGTQGCHLRGTIIQTRDGMKKIEDVKCGDLVWAGDAWRSCIPIMKGRQQTMKVTLRNGIVLNMTQDHRMKTNRGWVNAEDLIVGESLVQGNVPWSTGWNDDSERAMVVGMLLADGHLDVMKKNQKYDYVRKSNYKLNYKPKEYHEWLQKRIRLYNVDDEVHKRFREAVTNQYAATATGSYEDIFKGVRRSTVTCINNSFVFDEIVADGVPIGKKSDIIEIPHWIQCSDAAMNGFFAGYFVCDGSFYKSKGSVNGGIEITSCSEKIIRQMQIWLLARGIISRVDKKNGIGKRMDSWRLFLRQRESLKEWIDHVPNISEKKKVVLSIEDTKAWVKYGEETVNKWWEMRNSGMTYKKISDEVGVDFSTVWLAMNNKDRGKRGMKKNTTKGYLLEIENIDVGDVGDVYDLSVEDIHEYVANGLVSHNSGKSFSALSMCCFMDPNFSIENIFFNYNKLVQERSKIRQNSSVLVDEQSQVYGLDSHRVNIILANLKEQLRKKSVHFFFCSPVLYPESQSSMYILECMFVDYETKEVYAALKTREGLTLGHVRIPHPLKVLEDGSSLASKELIDAYQKKKDEHLEKVLGKRAVDDFEERAMAVTKHPLFKKAEKVYIREMGYIPNASVVQLINKIFPEYQAGVVPLEIAGRIKLNKEISCEWKVAGRITRKDRMDMQMKR
jgi:intein/homing endonuclease